MKIYIRSIIAFIIVGISTTSCDDFFDVNPDDKLLGEEYPTTYTELYSGFMGVAASVQSVADQAMFLEGLRGDFLEPTANATDEIIDIYNYVDDLSDNELASPAGYYNVILNANDYIKHATDFYLESPNAIDETTFDGLVGGAIRYKCWAYLMLAKLYGEAVWLDEPLVEYKDLSEYPTIGFDAIVDNCIHAIVDGYKVTKDHTIDVINSNVRWTDVLDASGELQWNRFCPTAQMLLSELYLYNGSYALSISYGFDVLLTGADDTSADPSSNSFNPSFSMNLAVDKNKWANAFNSFARHEAMIYLPYNYDRNQTNRLVDYFANDPSCKYYMRPSQEIMDKFDSQTRQDGTKGDLYRGSGQTFREMNGEWVVYKFTKAHYAAGNYYRNDNPIMLYRTSDIFFFIIESMIQTGRITEAMALFENGVASYYDAANGKFIAPCEDFPYVLYSTHTFGPCVGVRGRVTLAKVGDEIAKSTDLSIEEKKDALLRLVVDETCLESAGESRALFAMIRVAKMLGDNSIVAERVSAKYPESMRSGIYSKLMDQKNWYIKYDLKK